MPMKDEDRADHADWVLEVNLGRTKMGFDDWRSERYIAEQDRIERHAEGQTFVEHAWHHGGKRIK